MLGNMHAIDRVLRCIIGLIMSVLPLFGSYPIFDVAAFSLTIVFIGIALIVTGLIGICPIYKAADFSTKK